MKQDRFDRMENRAPIPAARQRCVHVVFGAGRCDRDTVPGAAYCALHRGYIKDDPLQRRTAT